ncbi:MAG: acyl-CoA desaturase, partial [Phycisphaerae bacterium]|nr:acyl-CoA desaturase [Phycisphaerae bacterium]
MTNGLGNLQTTDVHDHAAEPHLEPPIRVKLINLAAVLIPFAGLVAAIALLWGVAFDWVHLLILGGMYLATAIGITIGYHRLFTHCSFKTSRPVVAILAALGSMAVEGPVLQWV